MFKIETCAIILTPHHTHTHTHLFPCLPPLGNLPIILSSGQGPQGECSAVGRLEISVSSLAVFNCSSFRQNIIYDQLQS